MDDLLYIQRLLDRFEAAETTEEEERLLTDYFASHDGVPAAWAADAVMFRGFHAKAFTKARQSGRRQDAQTVALDTGIRRHGGGRGRPFPHADLHGAHRSDVRARLRHGQPRNGGG